MGKGNNIHVLRNLPPCAPTSIGVSKDVRVYVRACVHSEGEKKRGHDDSKDWCNVGEELTHSIHPTPKLHDVMAAVYEAEYFCPAWGPV